MGERLKDYRAAIDWPWAVIGVVLTVAGPLLNQSNWHWWVIGGLAVLAIGSLEGAHQIAKGLRLKQDTAREKLSRLRLYGVVNLLARSPRNDAELGSWKKLREQWVDDVRLHLRQHFGKEWEDRFWVIGPMEGITFPEAINPEHDQELRILTNRLNLLDTILYGKIR